MLYFFVFHHSSSVSSNQQVMGCPSLAQDNQLIVSCLRRMSVVTNKKTSTLHALADYADGRGRGWRRCELHDV